MSAEVFISYAAKDRTHVLDLVERLRTAGVSVWIDQMGIDLADKFVGMYVNDWTLDYGEAGRESICRFLRRGHEMGVVPVLPELEFVE